jgi:phenylalanyl-tRNA synthetase beta chain
MNISYNWLKELIEIELSPQELAEKLTNAGLAVDSVEGFGDDYVLVFDLTSNRSDCLSHLGVAREIKALTGKELKLKNYNITNPETSLAKGETTYDSQAEANIHFSPCRLVTIEAPDLCHRFTARIIRNVKVGKSPEWLIRRLEAVGERAINNIADITNYVMHELGQPMHAFDLNSLGENRIVVRRARKGEKIKTLDEIERNLDETMLAICDAEKPVAIAGIMGGFYSGISESTTDVLLEVAYFDKKSIRQTSRKLKLSTEASYRFERGVDIENLVRASNRATELICEIAGGEADRFVDVYPTKRQEIVVCLKPHKFKTLIGYDVEIEDIKRVLSLLGFKLKDSIVADGLSFIVPSWRHDISIEEDLVEEIARILGYDRINEELPPSFSAGEYQPNEERKKNLRKTLADMGFDEAISYSFIDTVHDTRFEMVPKLVNENLQEKFITLKDSIIEGAIRMRPTLLAGLLDAVRTNFNRGERNLKLFEVGRVFVSSSDEEGAFPIERELFAMAITGGLMLENRALPIRDVDFYDIKGALEASFEALQLSSPEFIEKKVKHLRKGQSALVKVGGKEVGYIGRLSDELAEIYKFRQPIFVAEVDLQGLLELEPVKPIYQPLPIYPSIVRDTAFLVKGNVTFAQIRQAIKEESFQYLSKIEFVEMYQGKELVGDERSLTIRFQFRSNEKTLTEEEAEETYEKIVKFLEEKFGIRKRF